MATTTPLFNVGEKVNWILDNEHLAYRIIASARQPLLSKGGQTEFPHQGKDYIIRPIEFSFFKTPAAVHVNETQLIRFTVID